MIILRCVLFFMYVYTVCLLSYLLFALPLGEELKIRILMEKKKVAKLSII